MRILIVSNRLPITLLKENGSWTFQPSSGGLVTGLSAYLESLKNSSPPREHVWIGWPGGAAPEPSEKKEIRKRLFSEYRASPVFLTEEEMERFYHGFCNKTIWPLFHYFPSYTAYDESCWNDYKRVNQIFAEAVLETAQPDDVIWIHDYHLMLLPKLLRDKLPNASLGFFLHIPFPSFEIFRMLPWSWRAEILEGLLGADLVGFHTHDYTKYFLHAALRILGLDNAMGHILHSGRLVKADTFPMGIDFQKFHQAAERDREVGEEKEKLQKALSSYKIIFSVDRLDYSKGISKRLEGYEAFLEKNPDWHKKVVYLLMVVPSRIGVEHYQAMKKQIDELTGRINGRFGGVDWTPVSYQYGNIPFPTLTALYSSAHVALITPLRDGMNLVAKEYVASQSDKTGVLVLSEMAGASKELGEAVIINPNNKEEIAEAIKTALSMPQEEQGMRLESMQRRLARYDVVRWATDFLQALESIRQEQKRFEAKMLSPSLKGKTVSRFAAAQRRILFLDYDGTMVPFQAHPQLAKPTDKLLKLLERLANLPHNEVVILSGRDKGSLERWLGTLNVHLVAEHGIWIRERAGTWKLPEPLQNQWKSELRPLLELYADRLPGAFVEEKDFSLVWHYRQADQELGALRAKELMDNLLAYTANHNVQVLRGSKVIELKSASVNKGTAALYFLSQNSYDFILAVGDDWTDEDLFKALPESVATVKVGLEASFAKYNVRAIQDVHSLLEDLSMAVNPTHV